MWQRQRTTLQQFFNQEADFEHGKSRKISRDLRFIVLFSILEQRKYKGNNI